MNVTIEKIRDKIIFNPVPAFLLGKVIKIVTGVKTKKFMREWAKKKFQPDQPTD
jgi:hypothetical protein